MGIGIGAKKKIMYYKCLLCVTIPIARAWRQASTYMAARARKTWTSSRATRQAVRAHRLATTWRAACAQKPLNAAAAMTPRAAAGVLNKTQYSFYHGILSFRQGLVQSKNMLKVELILFACNLNSRVIL